VNKRCMSVVGSVGLSLIIEAGNEDVAYGKRQEVKGGFSRGRGLMRRLFLPFGFAARSDVFLGRHPRSGSEGDVRLGWQLYPIGSSPVVIELFVQFVFGDLVGRDASRWNLDASGPSNSIHYKGSIAVDCPVAVMVTARKTGSSSSVGSDDSPKQRLFFSFGEKAFLGP